MIKVVNVSFSEFKAALKIAERKSVAVLAHQYKFKAQMQKFIDEDDWRVFIEKED